MLASWISEELKTTDLKDDRLNARLKEVLSQLASRPTASIPAACGGRAEMEAAYRLFDNEKVTFENILESHCRATCGDSPGRKRELPLGCGAPSSARRSAAASANADHLRG